MNILALSSLQIHDEASPPREHTVNRETLLFLAWIAGQPHVEDLKIMLARGEDPVRILPAHLVSRPPIFEQDVYGPVYRALFYHRLAQIDWTAVGGALRGTQAISLKIGEEARSAGLNMETMIVWDIASQYPGVRTALRRMKRVWQRNPAALAEDLRTHFLLHQPLIIRSIESAFLVIESAFLIQELLAISLERVDWCVLAARLLGLPMEQFPYAESAREAERWRKGDWLQLQVALFLGLLQEATYQAERAHSVIAHNRAALRLAQKLCLKLTKRCGVSHSSERARIRHRAGAQNTVSPAPRRKESAHV